MANEFFTKSGTPASGSFGSSSAVRAEFSSVEAAFDKLPVLTGNAGEIVAVNAGATALEAITTTGTGSGVRATSPTLTTPAITGPTVTGPLMITPRFENPGDGSTVTLLAAEAFYQNIATASKAALTFSLPASPSNGQMVRIASAGVITTLTVTAPAAASVLNAPTTMAAGSFFVMLYRTANTTWYRVG